MKINKIILMFGVILLLASNISAFAISSQYWEENPVIMQPGEEKEVPLILQNLAGTESINAAVSIIQGNEISSIGITEYTILPGEKKEVMLKILIPKKAEEKYNIIISVDSKVEGVQTLNIGSSVEREIPVLVQKVPAKIPSSYWIIGILTIALIILIILLLKKKKKLKRKK